MKLTNILESHDPDTRFYVVNEPVKAWIEKGFQATNNHYGASRLHQMTYQEITLDDDDEIHLLPGGLFFVLSKDGHKHAIRGLLSKPGSSSPFEKNHSGISRGHIDDLNRLSKTGEINVIQHFDAAKPSYAQR